MKRVTRVVLAVATAVLLLMAPAMAHAETGGLQIDIPGDGKSWVRDSEVPLLNADGIAPGMLRSGVLRIRNNSAKDASITLRALHIADDDRACTRPESRVDTTCGTGSGELGSQVRVRVYLGQARAGSFRTEPAFSGSIYELGEAVTLTRSLAAAGERQMKLTLLFPPESGNETQTDRLSFDLRLAATQATGTAQPEEISTSHITGTTINSSGAATIAAASGSPWTLAGLPAASLAMLGGAALLVGYALFALNRRIRHPRTAPVNGRRTPTSTLSHRMIK